MSRRRTRSRGLAAVDAACNGTARHLDDTPRDRSCRTCRRQCRAVDVAANGARREVHFVARGASILGLYLCAVGICCLRPRIQDEFVRFSVARCLDASIRVPLGVFDHAAARVQRRTAARHRQCVVLDGFADDGASAPCAIGCCAPRIGCIFVVLEAVPLEVDVLWGGTVAVGHKIRLVVVGFDVPARSCRTVVAEVDSVGVLQERKDMVARRTRRDAVEVVDIDFLPVQIRRAVREGQERVARRNMWAIALEMHRVKVLDILRRRTVIDVQRVARRVRLVSAVNGANDRT